jgi:hypothetical protein
MTHQELLKLRLANQNISNFQFNTPGEIVKWHGAMQAQDYMGSLWAIGCRLKNFKEKDIEAAIAKKGIVRTWPMRGTLHFVAPEDAKWMLQLLTPRVISRAQSEHRRTGLDKETFDRSRKIFIKALQGGKQLSRSEMYLLLEGAKISTSNTRGLHILGVLAQQGLICFGPRIGKQPSFVLLDEWITNHNSLKGDEAIAALTERYFTSHGPATIQDFCWWSGLTQTEAKRGLEMVKQNFVEEKINEQSFWMKATIPAKIKTPGIYLLPPFDEYLVAYKDRSAALENLHLRKVFSINGIFSPVVIINGKIAAAWKRAITKKEVIIELQAFQKFTPSQKEAIRKAAKKYSRFTGLTPTLLF